MNGVNMMYLSDIVKIFKYVENEYGSDSKIYFETKGDTKEPLNNMLMSIDISKDGSIILKNF
ncbi:MAG: hypothetical protein PHF29_08420 [Candidatus Riflebacteria bacterium]|nr:hypothetical protein [Candidatus Riflebacteria bacterium]